MKKTFLPIMFFLSFFVCYLPFAFADGPTYNIGGYFRNFLVVTDSDENTTYEDIGRLRLQLDYRPIDALSVEFAYELVPRYKEYEENDLPLIVPSPGPRAYRVDDIDEQLYPEDDDEESDLMIFQNLDRALLAFSQENVDIYVGRQAIAFGSAHVINPLDIISPYTYNTLAKEERIGVDAVRARTPLGPLGEFDIGYVFGEDFEFEKSAAFIRTKFYVVKTDIALMGIMFRENYLVGLDISRSIGGAGTWIEAGYVVSEEGSDENYFNSSVGADYSVTDKLYAYIEYHYNGAGRSNPHDYIKSIGKTAYTDGSVYLLARHYIAPGFSYQLTPLLTFTGQVLVNLNDISFIASPSLAYSISDNVNIQLGAFIGVGEESDLPFEIESEFGLYPDTYFASLDVYF